MYKRRKARKIFMRLMQNVRSCQRIVRRPLRIRHKEKNPESKTTTEFPNIYQHTTQVSARRWSSQQKELEQCDIRDVFFDFEQADSLYHGALVQTPSDSTVNHSPIQIIPNRNDQLKISALNSSPSHIFNRKDQFTFVTVEQHFQFKSSFERPDKTAGSLSLPLHKAKNSSMERLTAYLLLQEEAILDTRRKRQALQASRRDWSDGYARTFLTEEKEHNRMEELRLDAQKQLMHYYGDFHFKEVKERTRSMTTKEQM